jgi:hypothetical protein
MLVYVIRNPGCRYCFNYGIQLTELTSQFKNVACLGIVKDTHISNRSYHTALLQMYQESFSYPYYKDTMLKRLGSVCRHGGGSGRPVSSIYEILGNRTTSSSSASFRWKKIKNAYVKGGNTNNDDDVHSSLSLAEQVLGGILIFDNDGILRHMYQEIYQEEMLDFNALREAIQLAQLERSCVLSWNVDDTSTLSSYRAW